MSLLQSLQYKEYREVSSFPLKLCEVVAKLANLQISFVDVKNPGERLVKYLDRHGYSLEQYRQLLHTAQNVKTITTYYKPQCKIAILIANDKYLHLSKLATPSMDCDSLASKLKNLGFIIVLLKNMQGGEIRDSLVKIFEVVPEDSYCFIFYAGHGCELYNVKCMLSIDCPMDDITMDHCVTEKFVLSAAAKCKPDLCVLIMDMCRVHLNREANPLVYTQILCEEEYTIHKNLIVTYTTQPSQAAYEILQIEMSHSYDDNKTYEIKPGDTDKIVPGASQYVNELCTRIMDNSDINSLLDKVHGDVENSIRKQRPIKVQCGVAKRSFYDPVIGDTANILEKLKELYKTYREKCTVF